MPGEAQVGLNPEGLGEEPLTEQVSLAPTQPEDAPSLGAITDITRHQTLKAHSPGRVTHRNQPWGHWV